MLIYIRINSWLEIIAQLNGGNIVNCKINKLFNGAIVDFLQEVFPIGEIYSTNGGGMC